MSSSYNCIILIENKLTKGSDTTDGFYTNNPMCACNPRVGSMLSLLVIQHYEHIKKPSMLLVISKITKKDEIHTSCCYIVITT